jgi:hypothetical protein
MVSRIYRQTHFISIPICNEHHEQCQGEEEQFLWSLEHIDEYIPLIYPYVMNTVNSARVKGHNFYGF